VITFQLPVCCGLTENDQLASQKNADAATHNPCSLSCSCSWISDVLQINDIPPAAIPLQPFPLFRIIGDIMRKALAHHQIDQGL